MGKKISGVATKFSGIRRTSENEPISLRNDLFAPSDSKGILLNSRLQLWYPRAFSLMHDFGTGHITKLSVLSLPTPSSPDPHSWILVQIGNQLHKIRSDGLVDDAEGVGGNSWPITLSFSKPGYLVTSFSSTAPSYRGYYGSGGQTWRLYQTTAGALQATLVTGIPSGNVSIGYFGGVRWVADTRDYDQIGIRLHYSKLNQPETFDAGNFVDLPSANVGQDDQITGLINWSGGMLTFTEREMFLFRATSDTDLRIDRLDCSVGAVNQECIKTHSSAIYFLSLTAGREGVYRYNGQCPDLVSQPIGQFFRSYRPEEQSGSPDDYQRPSAEIWGDYYVLSVPYLDPARKLYIGDISSKSPEWMTSGSSWENNEFSPRLCITPALFGGSGTGASQGAALLASNGGAVYETRNKMARFPGETGTVTIGYFDADAPHEVKRFLTCKLILWKTGTGNPTYNITFTSDSGQTNTTTGSITATSGQTGNLVLPVAMRCRQVKVTVTITPANDDNQVTLEHLELISSTKEMKPGRG